jgi:hypothetical protein
VRFDHCEICGAQLQIGEWPFCPHGFPYHGLSIIDDQLEGGPRRFETLGHDAPYIESKSQLRREAAARGLMPTGDRKPAEYFAKHRKMQDECIRDTGVTLDGLRVR